MRYKTTFLTGFAAGYVLGSRAGRRRYEQIVATTRRIMRKPAVQQFTATARGEATDLLDTARRTFTERFAGHDVTANVAADREATAAIPV